jgi:hypothetical protein
LVHRNRLSEKVKLADSTFPINCGARVAFRTALESKLARAARWKPFPLIAIALLLCQSLRVRQTLQALGAAQFAPGGRNYLWRLIDSLRDATPLWCRIPFVKLLH